MKHLALTAFLVLTAVSQAHPTPILLGFPGSGDISNAGSSPGYTQGWVGTYGGVDTMALLTSPMMPSVDKLLAKLAVAQQPTFTTATT